MANKKTTTKSSGNNVLEGLAAVAAVAAAAGAVFLYATDSGKKKRKDIKGWMLKAKGEVLEKLESVKDINEDAYNAIVDTVTAKYSKMKTLGTSEVETLAKELKGHWSTIRKEVAPQKTAKKVVKTVKKAATKTVKTVAKKPATKTAKK